MVFCISMLLVFFFAIFITIISYCFHFSVLLIFSLQSNITIISYGFYISMPFIFSLQSTLPSFHMIFTSLYICTQQHKAVGKTLHFRPPRWPSGVRLGSGRSGVRIPLATGFFRIESTACLSFSALFLSLTLLHHGGRLPRWPSG